MGGRVNLQGGGQYQMPSVQGGEGYNPSYTPSGYGARFGGRGNYGGGYGMPQTYDGGGYGDFGGQYPGVSTGGKGFQQPQYNYQPAPVMQPYVDQTSTGGKGFQPRPTPSQSVAYAPMNIPRMSFAQPQFYYPNIGNQMANLNANYGIGGLGAMGAFGNYGMVRRPTLPDEMQMYPALQPPTPPTQPSAPPIATGGKGFQPNQPTMPPPTSTGGKGFQPNPVRPDVGVPSRPYNPDEPDYNYYNPDLNSVQPPTTLKPVAPPTFDYGNYPSYPRPGRTLPEDEQIYSTMPTTPPAGLIVPNEPSMPDETYDQYTPTEPASPTDNYAAPEREYFPEQGGDFGMETLD